MLSGFEIFKFFVYDHLKVNCLDDLPLLFSINLNKPGMKYFM